MMNWWFFFMIIDQRWMIFFASPEATVRTGRSRPRWMWEMDQAGHAVKEPIDWRYLPYFEGLCKGLCVSSFFEAVIWSMFYEDFSLAEHRLSSTRFWIATTDGRGAPPLWLCWLNINYSPMFQHSYWKWPGEMDEIDDLPIENGDFPGCHVELPESTNQLHDFRGLDFRM